MSDHAQRMAAMAARFLISARINLRAAVSSVRMAVDADPSQAKVLMEHLQAALYECEALHYLLEIGPGAGRPEIPASGLDGTQQVAIPYPPPDRPVIPCHVGGGSNGA